MALMARRTRMSLVEGYRMIQTTLVEGYRSILTTLVEGYRSILTTLVEGYRSILMSLIEGYQMIPSVPRTLLSSPQGVSALRTGAVTRTIETGFPGVHIGTPVASM
mmetsp:Transcript_35782/g.78351  ORF Transcript_35782/g.78351 Transcript_35782/m.78351 type:complete len:106 (+) Transcript_35782:292-609(+)